MKNGMTPRLLRPNPAFGTLRSKNKNSLPFHTPYRAPYRTHLRQLAFALTFSDLARISFSTKAIFIEHFEVMDGI